MASHLFCFAEVYIYLIKLYNQMDGGIVSNPNLKEEVKKIISKSGMWVSCDFDEGLSQKEQDLMFDDLSVAITSLIHQKCQEVKEQYDTALNRATNSEIELAKILDRKCQESYIKGMKRVIYQPFPHNKFEDEIDRLSKDINIST